MPSLVEHFDHFVVPVDDIVAAEDFYSNVLGCPVAIGADGVPMRMGLSVRYRVLGVAPHTFFIAAGKRIGIFLQDEPRPKPLKLRGAPTYSLEASAVGIEQVREALAVRGMAYELAESDESLDAERSLYFTDPAGNHLHLYKPRKPAHVMALGGDTLGPLNGVGYIRLEAPDLPRSTRFYTEAFDIGPPETKFNADLGAPEVRWYLPSGQALILTEQPFAPKGLTLSYKEGGPHIAFYVPCSSWSAMMARLTAMKIPYGDRGADYKGRTELDRDVYFEDPAGYVIQLISSVD